MAKLFLLQTTFAAPAWPLIWATVLGTTLIGVIGFARSGSAIFWKPAADEADAIDGSDRPRVELAVPAALVALLVLLALAAGWATAQTQAAAAQIFAPERYIAAVLKGEPR